MDKIYCYHESDVLINKFNIKDNEKLENIERKCTWIHLLKLERDPIEGNFDLEHLKKIHKCLFQDVYKWAGTIRSVDISKKNWFCLTQNIKYESDRIFGQIKKEDYLRNLKIDKFSDRLAYHSGEINDLHPFREGNGRSTREFIRCLANKAGYTINYNDIDKENLFNAFVKSFVDCSDLKIVFKNHIEESIKNQYVNELLCIKNASEFLLDKLHELKNFSSDGEYCTIKSIKSKYKELGHDIEKGLLNEKDSTFRLLSDIDKKLKILKVKNNTIEKNISKNISMEHEL